jgi:hypothetical protein
MKVAIIFSGHTRTFAQCYPTFYWHVQRHYPDASVIFSTVDDEDYRKCLKNQVFPAGWRIGLHEQPSFTFSKEWTPKQFFTHEPHPISVHPENVMRQLWQLEQAYKLYIANTEDKDFAELFIRTRPDLWWTFYDHRHEELETMEVWPPQFSNVCLTPWWGRFCGVNDRFAIMGREAADAYFMTFSKIHELRALGAPLHPETLVKASLEHADIVVHDDLRAEFNTIRTNGIVRLPEMTIEDLGHAMLRKGI